MHPSDTGCFDTNDLVAGPGLVNVPTNVFNDLQGDELALLSEEYTKVYNKINVVDDDGKDA